MAILIDTLEATETLKKAGFKKAQAVALVEALSPESTNVVSKDLLESAINKLKSELIVWMVGLHLASITLIFTLLS